MKRDKVEKFGLAIHDGTGQRTATLAEISHLTKILEEIPLNLEPFDTGKRTEVRHYPQGGRGSAAIVDLIRISPPQRVEVTKGKRAPYLKFQSNTQKCLKFLYIGKENRVYTLEIDN